MDSHRQLSKLYCLWTVQVKKWIVNITSLPAQETLWSICSLLYREMWSVMHFQWLYNVGAISGDSICTTISLGIHSTQPTTQFLDLTKIAPTSKWSNNLIKPHWVYSLIPWKYSNKWACPKNKSPAKSWRKWPGIGVLTQNFKARITVKSFLCIWRYSLWSLSRNRSVEHI